MPYIAGLAPAPDVEALMRSRYTAYTLGASDYLLRTWHPSTRPAALEMEPGLRWLGLKVQHVEGGQPGDASGRVTFIARCKGRGPARRIHEVSRFRREEGTWFYVDGQQPAPASSRRRT
jgi:SEC-C motif-containing protein